MRYSVVKNRSVVRNRLLAVLAVAVSMISTAGWAVAGAVEIASHRAVYALTMGKARGQGGAFVAAQGAMRMALEKTCDGWLMNQSMKMQLRTVDGNAVSQSLTFTAWESLDGLDYRFVSRSDANGKYSEARGNAKVESGSRTGKVWYRGPQPSEMVLPGNTHFPVGHMALLIERAKAGERSISMPVFDGSDQGGPQEVAAFVGQAVAEGGGKFAALGPLLRGPGWNMRLAFYPVGGRESVSEYEIEVVQLENGVSPRLMLDYHDFSVVLSMQSIEPLAQPSC